MNIFFILTIPIIVCNYDAYINLYNWLISNGAFISQKIIPFEADKYNRYIKAKEEIKKKKKLYSYQLN